MLNTETKRRIDNARDILVGKVPDPKTQVEQITFAMIYKFMDDMDQLSVRLGGNPSFFANGYEQYAWSKLMDRKISGADRLDLYVRALDQMAQNPHIPQLFRDVFKGAFLPYRDSETLNLFLKEMNGFTYDHSEDLGDAYEYLLSIFATQGKAGQFRTPRHIIDFIVDCVDPDLNDTVLDPACGTAGFLISAYKHILEKHADNPLNPDQKKRLTENFVGYDISPDMVRLSRVNMYLHQFPNPTIYEYDTLTTEDRWDDSFDVILANPPFMTPKGGIRPHKRFAVRANRSEVLFVDYIAEHLNVGGRAGVIVPEGIIFQSSNAYKALRKMLVEENYLYAVVSLPAGIFQPYSGVKTSVLLMDKALAKGRDSILFVKVENDGYDLGAQRSPIEKNDLPKALEIIKAFQANSLADLERSEIASAVKKAKLGEDGDYNYSVERYRKIIVANHKWPHVPLGDVCVVQSGSGFPKEYQGKTNEQFPFLKVSDMNLPGNHIYITEWNNSVSSISLQKLKAKIAPSGSIIFPKIGAAIATNKKRILTKPSVFDNNVMGLIPKENILSKFLYYVLLSIDLSDWASDSSLPSIRKSTIELFTIPLPPLEVQQEIVDEIEGYQKVIDGARQVVENYKPVIHIDPAWPLVKLGEVFINSRETLEPNKETGPIKYLSLANIESGSGKIIGDLDTEISDIKSTKKIYQPGDILYGKLRPNLNKVYLSDHKGICSTDILVLRKANENVVPAFFLSILLSKEFNEKVLIGVSGAQLPRVSWKYISSLLVPFPLRDVQNLIAESIKEEQGYLQSNQLLIEKFELKITNNINRVWEDR